MTQLIDKSGFSVITVCFQFGEAVCSHVPTGAHLPFSLFNFKGAVLSSATKGPYLYVDVMSVQLPPLDTHNQIWKYSVGRCQMWCVVQGRVCLVSTKQPRVTTNKWWMLISWGCEAVNLHLSDWACVCYLLLADFGAYKLYLCVLPGRWRCQQAGTCDPPACWDTRPPRQRRGPDTSPTQCSTSCCCVSPPCSAARSDAGQEMSGSPSLSWGGEETKGTVVGLLYFLLINQV